MTFIIEIDTVYKWNLTSTYDGKLSYVITD